jgi:hypothetical protein
MRSQKLPDQFELPFRFHGDPVMIGTMNGIHCDRCVLDTGAPITVLRIPEKSIFKNLPLTHDGFSLLDSLSIHGVEFGPIKVKSKIVNDLKAPEIFIGTSELRYHCLRINYRTQLIHFTNSEFPNENQQDFSEIGFSRGRPVIQLMIAEKLMKFVLDTGSNANWLFHKSQRLELTAFGKAQVESATATCGLGNISVQKSVLFSKIKIGGFVADEMKFLCANENDFGGPSATFEDGIIGTGQITEWFQGIQIIDFISNKFYLF